MKPGLYFLQKSCPYVTVTSLKLYGFHVVCFVVYLLVDALCLLLYSLCWRLRSHRISAYFDDKTHVSCNHLILDPIYLIWTYMALVYACSLTTWTQSKHISWDWWIRLTISLLTVCHILWTYSTSFSLCDCINFANNSKVIEQNSFTWL